MSGVTCQFCGEWFCDNTSMWAHQDNGYCSGTKGKKWEGIKWEGKKSGGETRLMGNIEMEALRWKSKALHRAIERGDYNYKDPRLS